MTSATRRHVLAGSAALAGTALAGTALPAPAIAQKAPIRLGFIGPLSGNEQIFGKELVAGAQIAIDQANAAGGIDGRSIEVVWRSDDSKAETAVAVARELSSTGINLLFGPLTTGSALGIVGILDDINCLMVASGAASDVLTHERFNRHFFRVAESTMMRTGTLARLAARRYPAVTSWAAIVPDQESSRSYWRAFRSALVDDARQRNVAPPQFADAVLTSPTQAEFKPAITALMNLPSTGLLNCTGASAAVSFIMQSKPYGLDRKYAVVVDIGNELPLAKAAKRNLPQNFWTASAWYYAGNMDLPISRALFEAYVKNTGSNTPTGFVAHGHTCALSVIEGIRRAGSTATDAVIHAMEGMKFDSAHGPASFRPEDHQIIFDINCLKVAPSDHDPGYEVTEFVRLPGGEAVEPPSPGKPMQYSVS